jgi:Na+-transporting NADH:ubiquinone oxidoreductase subunit B
MGVMSMFGADGMFSLSNSFLGLIPGSIGETSALAILLGAVLLVWTGIGSWKVMSSFLAGGLVMGLLFNVMGLNAYMTIPAIHQVVMGGFMFGMVFMATDPVSAAQTEKGKWIYGFFGGFLSIMIRVFNPAYPEGVMMAILFMNVMAPLIDHYVIEANVGKREKRALAAQGATA